MTTREPLTGWTLVHARRLVNPGPDWPAADRLISVPPPADCDHRYQARESDVRTGGSARVWYCARCGQVQP